MFSCLKNIFKKIKNLFNKRKYDLLNENIYSNSEYQYEYDSPYSGDSDN